MKGFKWQRYNSLAFRDVGVLHVYFSLILRTDILRTCAKFVLGDCYRTH